MSKRIVSWLFLGGLLTILGYSFFESPLEERNAKNLETGMVKINIAEHHFDVPLRYMYTEAMTKRQRWPEPKPDRVDVGGLHLSVLMPDFRPYYATDDARWKVRGHGEKIELSLKKGDHEWHLFGLRALENPNSDGRFYKKDADRYNLTYYAGKTGSRYYAKDGRILYVDCGSETPPLKWHGAYFPSCSVKSNYKSGLVLEYYYSLTYLPQWKEIDDGLKIMLDKFYQPQ